MASQSRSEFSPIGKGTLFDGAAYWATLAGIYLMLGGLMFYSGKGKLFDDDGHAPSGVVKQFEHSFLSTVPGTDVAWVILGVLELVVVAVLLFSLVRLEFLPQRPKSALQVALAISLFTFACLAFGQTATNQFEGTASLYQYFGATAVILILVGMLPPNRPDNWLSSMRNGG